MLRNVFAKTLWEQRRALLGWTIGITAVGMLYAGFYPMVRVPEYEQLVNSIAPDLMEALGFSNITSPAGYLGSTTFGLLGPVLTIIFGTWLGMKSVAGDEDDGKLDLLLAHPVTRWQLVMQRFAALVVAMLLVCAVLFVALVILSGFAGFSEIGISNLAAASLHLAVMGIFFGGLAMAIGAATASRAFTVSIVALVGVIGYFGNTMSGRIPEIGLLRDLSPFHYYSGGEPLVNGLQPIDLVVLLIAAVVLVFAGGFVFNRRDLAV
jgi:beta-exotoxin I transport system permease protein